jgi:hypothetical protein
MSVNKSTRREPTEKPDASSRITVWRTVATSTFNHEAAEIARLGKELAERAQEFVDKYDCDSLIDALADAGLRNHNIQYHRDTAASILYDMAGLANVLAIYASLIGGEVLPPVPTPEELEEERACRRR